jgi:electron transfer flavoprotein alpha subunit
MSNVIVVFPAQETVKINKAALVAITAARELQKTWSKGKLIGVVLGKGAKDSASAFAEFGFDEVLYSANAVFDHYLAEPYAEAVQLAAASKDADTILMTATSAGKDLAPRIAALLDAGQASEVIAINTDGSLKRPMFAGNVIADVELLSVKRVVTVRQTAFQPATPAGPKGTVTELAINPTPSKAQFVSFQASGGERPDLGDANIVVSGGRALKSSETFMQYIAPLADALGAAIGASRAAVDAGYAPNDWQVGQTGKVVAPSLYVAVGISGAIQHLAGMKDSKVIVALNKDPDAPIFEVATYGLVCDLFEAVPMLTEEIKKAKS